MLEKINSTKTNFNSIPYPTPKEKDSNTNFKGLGAGALIIQGLQECERNPMINVAVIDMLSAILPRSIVESMTNIFAGFEAFRRESSGLIVNCLLPSFVTLGFALGINKFVMPKGVNLSSCWADSKFIDTLSSIYEKSEADDKVLNTYKDIISNFEGIDGKETVKFKECLTEKEIETYAKELKELAENRKLAETKKGNEKYKEYKNFRNKVKELSEKISAKTHVFENVKLVGKDSEATSGSLRQALEDSAKYVGEYTKVSKDVDVHSFAKMSKKLVRSKTALGFAFILPLAASMQFINRWITKKLSGVEGAPIYDDYGKDKPANVDKKAKEGLLKQKIISITSMLGVSLLSLMKLPTANMLEFKGIFPTMDQARIISTTTFASRMAAADDKNELAEATVRDIATFASLYFLGDYAAKAAATVIQNKSGVTLLNETKALEKDAGFMKRAWHWIKHTNIKSSEEVVSKTAQKLKEMNKTPDEKEKKIIEKELGKARYYRSACQLTNLGVSLVLLGLVIPICTRNKTKRKHAEANKIASGQDSSLNSDDKKAQELSIAV